MTQRIRSISVGQAAKVFGILYGLMGLILIPFFWIVIAAAPKEAGSPFAFGVGVLIFIPVFYAIIGFIGTAIACAVYNWVAGKVGGIEVQLDGEGTMA
jgi:hypothetical protein